MQESLTVYSLIVNAGKIGTGKFANIYDCVLIA